MTPTLKAAFYRLSLESIGIYPQAVIDSDGTRHERTPYQEGWNAARFLMSQTYFQSVRWFQALSRNHQAAMTTLMESSALELHATDDQISVACRCNDTFLWGSADGEELPPEAWMLLADLWRRYGYAGLIAWIAHQRNDTPMQALITPQYTAAWDWLATQAGVPVGRRAGAG